MSHSLDAVFNPRSIAVVGASSEPGSIGREVLRNLIAHGFGGRLVAVDPGGEAVDSVASYPRVSDVPEPVDLAIIALPKWAVLDSIEDCGAKGVAGVVVVTAGFGELGGAGAELESEL